MQTNSTWLSLEICLKAIPHFINEKGTGTETSPAIGSGIVRIGQRLANFFPSA